MSMRGRGKTKTGLSPFEVIMGRPMNTGLSSTGQRLPLRRKEFDDAMLNYCINLSNSLKTLHTKVKATLPAPLQGSLHSLQPGDWVVVKDRKRHHWRKPHWTGPFLVLLVTNSAVKVAESATWIHASHCRKVLPLDMEIQGESSAPPPDEEEKQKAQPDRQ